MSASGLCEDCERAYFLEEQMPRQTVKLTYKMSEYIEIDAPTHIDGVVKAAQMLMRGEIRPTGKGELQPATAYIEMPPEQGKVPNCS